MENAPEGDVDGEETRRGNARRHQHAPRGRDADEDAVVDKRRHPRQRNQQRPREIWHRGIHHRCLVGEQPEKPTAARRIAKREQRHRQQPPEGQPATHPAEARTVARTVSLPTESLGGKREAVHHIREYRVESEQQRVHRKNQIALSRAKRGKKQIDRYEKYRAQENIAIDPEEARHGLAHKHRTPADIIFEQSAIIPVPKHQRDEQSRPLRQQRAQRHALYLQPQPTHQCQRHHHIDHILQNAHQHGDARVLHAHKPPRQTVKTQHRGRAPYTDVKVSMHRGHHRCRGVHEQERQPTERPLENQKPQGDEQPHGKRPQEEAQQLRKISPAQSLRGHPTRSHAQEAEKPIDNIKRHRPHRDRRDILHATHVADDGKIDKSQKGHRNIRYDRRNG